MNIRILPIHVVAAALALLAGCTGTKLATQAQLPPPLIDKLPARVGIYYSKEFREYVHKETRSEIAYEITLGPAHVQNIDWLLNAMFSDVVKIEDPAKVADIRPPLVMVLEPRFEEYSFLTPKDVAGEAFIVTIRYLLTLYDGSGARVDAFTFTGYGREKARTLASKEPLKIATQRAMRDAGAKFAVEFTDQESVRLLLKNPRGLIEPPAATVAPAATVMPPAAPATTMQPPAAEPPPPAGEPPPPAEEPPPPVGEPPPVVEPPPSTAG
ncbi:MAG: hypothetical protein WBO00_10760 [Steroidobacteraceae bacterium]